MTFACQRDSYLQEHTSEVVRCESATLNVGKAKVPGFNVVFKDTVLFPEGGGQNDDRGWVDDVIPVLRVVRGKQGEAVHFLQTPDPPKVRQVMSQKVDWVRRFDHMQQHSGQHLISAIFEQELEMPTLSWWMAEEGEPCMVELDTSRLPDGTLTTPILKKIEDICNLHIRNHCNVNVKVYPLGDPALDGSKTRGLPDDVTGDVRVIEMVQGSSTDKLIDSNMCCGTHVSNLSHLQAIKLLNWDKSKKNKTAIRLNFLVGDRVLKYLATCYERERQLTAVLNNGPQDHVRLVEKSQTDAKYYKKKLQTVLKGEAEAKAKKIRETGLRYHCEHRPEADGDYVNTLVRGVDNDHNNNKVLIVVAVGEEKTGCQLTIYGPEKLLETLSPQIMSLLRATGGGKGNRVTAKFKSYTKFPQVSGLVSKFIQNEYGTLQF